jgi:NADPH:quinone reductase-like Zn-dependent oxidoreductase
VRAAVVGHGSRYEVVSLPDPAPSPGELLLRVTACGLCGSDMKARGALLSRRFDLSLVNDAFDDLARAAAGAKILIDP